MSLPFTPQQFFLVFEQYNESVWPAQALLYVLALLVFYNILKPGRLSDRLIAIILAVLWLWMGIVYHWAFFAAINPAARLFALLFIAEGIVLFYTGLIQNKLRFSFDKQSRRDVIGLSLAAFGPLLYPLFGYALGHRFPEAPTFGLPCPTTIFTLGTLLLARGIPKHVFLIPCLWSLIGFLAAVLLGVKEDVFLLLAGLLAARYVIFPGKADEKSADRLAPIS